MSHMLGGIRAEGASVSRISLEPSWTTRFAHESSLTMLTLVVGGGSVILGDGSEYVMNAGDTALVKGPEPFRLAAAVPGDSLRTGEGTRLGDRWPDQGEERTTAVVGAYRSTRAGHERLLRALPQALVLHEETDDVLWLQSLEDALRRSDRAGGQAMIDRVLDWGLVCTLGCWFDMQGREAPPWYLAVTDPVVGPALETIHQYPAEPWTVGSLAAEAHVSRAYFARRFTEAMGQAPLRYLTEWRMDLAEELLSDPNPSVREVAAAVGYSDPFAFSTAFKRHRGMSPRDFRTRHG
uniref:AraC family transcriptional regulator n=1 Tax=Glycomyces xiaoerkulensis TaxID=2038139 RepID=UPI001E3DF7C6|nr:AraC family transcriptional regulator [Glycomyces xiaoerkulensis]